MSNFSIYALCDPQTNTVRYIGYSKRVQERYKWHIEHEDTVTHRGCWVGKLVREGFVPVLRILCIVQEAEEAKRVEIALIAAYKQKGVKLTNGTAGGDGVSGTLEVRAKQAFAASVPCTEAKKLAISKALTGRPATLEQIIILTKNSRSMTREQIEKRNKAISDAWTPEVRVRAGAAVKAGLTSEGIARRAAGRRGKKSTDVHCKAISDALTGRKQSTEHIENHRRSLNAGNARRKALKEQEKQMELLVVPV